MALYYPLVDSKPLSGSCIGKFFSPNVSHIAIPDGNDLEFRQIAPPEVSRPFKVRLLSVGLIVSVKVVPYTKPASSDVEGKLDNLDKLVVLSQVEANGSLSSIISFKKFNLETSELCDLETLTFESQGDANKLNSSFQFDVNTLHGTNFGTVYFSDNTNKAYLIDSSDPKRVVKLPLKDHKFPTPAKPFWLDDNHIALVQETKLVGHTTFVELVPSKVSHNNKNSPSFKILGILPETTMQRILHIGPVKSKRGDACVIFYPKFVALVEFDSKKPSEKKSFGYDLVPGTSSFTTLISDESHSIFLSSSREVYKYDLKKQELQRLLNTYVDRDISIEHIAGPYFKRSSSSSCISHLSTYKLDKNLSLQEHVVSGVQFDEWTNLQWLAHNYDQFSGKNTYWSHNSAFSGRTNLISSEMSDVLWSSRLKVPNQNSPIKHVWLINENPVQFLYSTHTGTSIVELNPNSTTFKLNKVDDSQSLSGILKNEPTLAAAPGIQVTSSKIVYADYSKSLEIPFECAVTASISSGTVTVASVSDIFVLTDNVPLEVLQLDSAIIGTACNSSKIAILTSQSICIYNAASSEKKLKLVQNVELPSIAYSVAIKQNNEVVVALSDGRTVSIPDESVFSAGTPFRELKTSVDGGFYGIDPIAGRISLFNENNSLVKYANFPGCLSLIEVPSKDFVIVVANGGLYGLMWNDSPVQQTSDYLFPSIESFNWIKMREDRCFWFDSVGRRLYSALIDCGTPVTSSVKTLHFPPVDVANPESEFYLVDDPNIILEIIKYRNDDNSDNGDESDEGDFWENDSDYDDFKVNLIVRLYKLQYSKQKLAGISQLAEKCTSIEGDPFEAIIVKFFTPTDFTLFSYSAQCVPFKIEESNGSYSLSIGSPRDTEANVYDDHWIYSTENSPITVIDFQGYIYAASIDTFSTSSYPTRPSECVQILSDPHDMIFDARRIGSKSESVKQYCALVKNRKDNSRTKICLFEYDGVTVSNSTSFFVNGQAMLIEYNSEAIKRADNSPLDSLNRRMWPRILVGTTNGSLYSVSPIEDVALQRVLSRVQSEILKQLDFPDNFFNIHSDRSESVVINGSLLNEGVDLQSLRELLTEQNVNPTELREFFKSIVA